MAAKDEKNMIGKYKVTKMLAKGGMGAVYQGIHPTLKQPVILKKLTLKGSPQFAERFKREARIMMGFNNDNIVDVYDHFKIGRSDFIVLEYVDGMSLEELLRQERYLPNDLALYIFREAARALKYAHDKGVVHRDVKPANLLISRNGEIKLVDFGIAASDEEEDQDLTQEGMTLGTPSYMAPEQITDSKGVDKRADIYSLGVMLYEMTTGKKPYPGSFTPEAIAKIQKGKYPPPRKYNPNISSPLVALIKKMMKPKPKRRLKDLEKALRVADARLRHKNVRRIQQYLTACIRDSKKEPLKKPMAPATKFFMVGLPLIMLILAGGSFAFLRSGMYYEVFQPRHYGALKLQISVPSVLGKAGDLRLHARMYRLKGEKEILLDQLALPFRNVTPSQDEENSPEKRIMAVPRRYLPSGNYRLEILCENQIITDTFYLASRYRQRQTEETARGRLLSYAKTMPQPLPVELNWTIRDRSSGQDITPVTRVSLHFDGKWNIFRPGMDRQLRTGGTIGFRLEARGYETEEIFLPVDPTRTQLTLEAALEPLAVPVKLINRGAGRRLQIKLEGDRVYRDAVEGDSTLPYLRSEEEILIHLYPGEWTLEAARSSQQRAEETFTLASEGITLTVSAEEESGELRIIQSTP